MLQARQLSFIRWNSLRMSKVFLLLDSMLNRFNTKTSNSQFGTLVVNGDLDNSGIITSKATMLSSLFLIAQMLKEFKKPNKLLNLPYNRKIWLESQFWFMLINRISLSFQQKKFLIDWNFIKFVVLVNGRFKDALLFTEKVSTKVWTGFLLL